MVGDGRVSPAQAASGIAGLVLAGGRGQRLGGVDKGLVAWRGEPLAARALRRLAPQVDEVWISANRHLDAYRTLGAPWHAGVVRDGDDAFAGPLAGLAAGLAAARRPWLVCVPCDVPHFPLDLVARLQHGRGAAPMAIAAAGPAGAERLHPVFALVPRERLPALLDYLEGGGRRVAEWLRGQGAATVRFDDARAFDNLNTPEELQAAAAAPGPQRGA